jgi:hypothetical protein
MLRTQEVLRGLVGKCITFTLTTGDELTARLVELTEVSLIINQINEPVFAPGNFIPELFPNSKKIGVVSRDHVIMILEAEDESKTG